MIPASNVYIYISTHLHTFIRMYMYEGFRDYCGFGVKDSIYSKTLFKFSRLLYYIP